jgi:hypothetical protein
MAINITPMNKKVLFIRSCFGFILRKNRQRAAGRKGRELKMQEGITILGDGLADPRQLFAGKIADDAGATNTAAHGYFAGMIF